MAMDAWVSIPFMMILLLAGLQALPKEVLEAAKVDGANGWQSFWQITFPLMLPVSVTALILRIIFELKLADIVINVTAGGPGGATDTVSSFIYREYRDRSNVGYGTMLADVLSADHHRLPHGACCACRAAGCSKVHLMSCAHCRRESLVPCPPHAQPPETSAPRTNRIVLGRVLIYGALLFWAFVCLFPIYWTVTTSFKIGGRRDAGPSDPLARLPAGLERLALARPVAGHDLADLDRARRIPRAASTTASSPRSAPRCSRSCIGSLAAYGLSRFRLQVRPGWRNNDISFFFLSQLILPPVVLALPFLVLYKELALLDTRIGLILLYTLMVLPIVIWIMRDQFNSIPIELEQAALVDGLSVWGAFMRIVLPIALPGMVAAFILSLVLCWNEYFFAALLTSTDAKTLARHGGEPDRLAGHQLVVDGGALDGRDRAARA